MANPVSYGAVLWDVGGVLLRRDDSIPVGWEQRLGLERGGFYRALYGGNDDTALIGRVSESEWWDEVALRLGAPATVIDEIKADLWRPGNLDEALISRIRELHDVVPQAILSNAWSGARQHLAELGIASYFEALVLSAEVGFAKPAAEIYRRAATAVGVKMEACVLIDDDAGNVEAARALGMGAIHHATTAATLANLRIPTTR